MKHPQSQCGFAMGRGRTILNATADECQAECNTDGVGCTGFVRVNSGSQYAGNCYLRSVQINPSIYTRDNRDCFAKLWITGEC